MTAASRATAILVVVAVAVIAALLATCSPDAPTPPASTPGAAPKPPAPRKPRRTDTPSGPADTTAAGVHGRSAAAEDDALPEDDGYPFIDVEIVNHDGTPASNGAVVYALPAGKTSDVEPPNGNVEDGRCRLHVLRPGRYDIGAVDGTFGALAQDIDLPRPDSLRIVLPEPADVVRLGEPPLVSDNATWPGSDFTAEPSDGSVAPFPGRGQQLRWECRGRFEQITTRFGVVVPQGATGHVRFDSPDVSALPGTFTAPAELRVVRAGRYPLTLRVAFESPGTSFPHAVALSAEFSVGEVAAPTVTWTTELAANQSVGAVMAKSIEMQANANVPEGTIRWKGNGIMPGALAFNGLVTDVERILDVTLRLAPDAPDSDTRGDWFSLRATGGDGAGLPATARAFVWIGTVFAFSSGDVAPGDDAGIGLPGAK